MKAIQRVVNGKMQNFERRERVKNYNVMKTFKFNDVDYQEFANVCKKQGKSANEVIRNFTNNYAKENADKVEE